MIRHVGLLALASLLTGCGIGDFIGSSVDEARLPGERIPVMLLERQITSDPSLAALEIRLPPPERNGSWPQANGLPHHAMQHLAAGDNLQLVWSTEAGEPSDEEGFAFARPIVAGGRVYTLDAEAVVRAFAAGTGALLWETEIEGVDDEEFLGGGLAHADGWLFVTLSGGDVLGLNAASGVEVWRQALGLPLRAPPTVAGDRVLILSADNQLYALEGTTGRPTWRHAGFFESAGILGGPSPAVDRGVVVVPYSSAEVFALRLDTGRPIWNDTIQRPRRTLALAEINDIDGAPVVFGNRVYVAGHGGQMAALDIQRGIRSWDIDLASVSTPWLAGDYLYVLTTRSEVVCLLRDSGRVRWVSPLARVVDPGDPSSEPVTWNGPVLVGDRLLFASSTGEVLAMSPYNGEILGRIDVDDPVTVAPVVAENTVYILTAEFDLLALR